MKTPLVVALVASPLAAAAAQLGAYVWVGEARLRHERTGFHLIAAAAIAVTLVAALGAVVGLRRARTPGEKLLATIAVVLGVYFTLLVVAFEVPVLVLAVED